MVSLGVLWQVLSTDDVVDELINDIRIMYINSLVYLRVKSM